jgi:stringent starvation protein B
MSDIIEKPLSSTKPYLLRAFYEWIVDNKCAPYIIVNTKVDGVEVPENYIHDYRIVLNIAMRAVNKLKISNDSISFEARFSGILKQIFIPLEAILAIYANENGHGMVFSEEGSRHEETPALTSQNSLHSVGTHTATQMPSTQLSIVRKESAEDKPLQKKSFTALNLSSKKKPPTKGRPHLTLVT